LWQLGYNGVAGVDEVGLGPLAGPVVAAAVIFTPHSKILLPLADSKRLPPKRRDELDTAIRETALAFAFGVVDVEELDALGVHRAGLEAMRRAVVALSPPPDYLLVDARVVPGVSVGQTSYVKADTFIYSVAAASIVAKVYRDRRMLELSSRFPGYGFDLHMGYGTPAHLNALARLGPSAVHRRSFEPVRALLGLPSGDRT
jgi:ribonuclease HII